MRIDFSPRLFRDPSSPPGGMGSLLNTAAGSNPYGAIAQSAIGLAQTVGGWIQQHKATKALENLKSPTYNQNKGILDYYNKSLAKYNVNPYATDYYRMADKMSGRNLSSGLSALQGRGQALAGVNTLVQGRNDALLKAGATAEDINRQDLTRVGQAANMKAGEDRMAFDINQNQPFQRKYNLLAQKASGGTSIANAGLSNIFGGLNSTDQYRMINKIYG